MEDTKGVKTSDIYSMLKAEMATLLTNTISISSVELPQEKPYVIMVVGVNGVGKTTTIGKLAAHFRKIGFKSYAGSCRYLSGARQSTNCKYGQAV